MNRMFPTNNGRVTLQLIVDEIRIVTLQGLALHLSQVYIGAGISLEDFRKDLVDDDCLSG